MCVFELLCAPSPLLVEIEWTLLVEVEVYVRNGPPEVRILGH